MRKVYNLILKVAAVSLIIFSTLMSLGFILTFKKGDLLVSIIALLIVWVPTYFLAKYAFRKRKDPVVTTQDRNYDTITIQPVTNNIETQELNNRLDTPSHILDKSNESDKKHAVSDIEKRIIKLQNENPNISEEEIKTIILAEKKQEIINNILDNVNVEIKYNNSKNEGSPNVPTSKVIPTEKISYSKVRKLTPNFVVLDFETTGLSNISDEIIQVAAVRYRNFLEIEKLVSFVKPTKPIPSYITEINGISNEDVRNAPSIKEFLPKLITFLDNDVIIAHNASFDMKFLLSAMYKEGIDFKKFKVIDTLSLARKYIDSTKNHKLPTLKSFLRLNHLNSHEALHDCYVAAELYKYCYEESLVNN